MQALRRILNRVVMALAFLAGLFGVMQLIPYGRAHTNPVVIQEPDWDHPRTRELAVRACFDCHSNETKWPWYANVAPMSWIMQRHVDIGRTVLNFSDWTRTYELANESGRTVIRRDMPPPTYRFVHGDAELTHNEKVELDRGLQATLGVPWRE